MVELRGLCEQVGFVSRTTCIQTGNVTFWSPFTPLEAKARLEAVLASRLGAQSHRDLIRTARELSAIVANNPFPEAAPNHYPDGMGRSKLVTPLTGAATSRNLNTVTKLAALAGGYAFPRE